MFIEPPNRQGAQFRIAGRRRLGLSVVIVGIGLATFWLLRRAPHNEPVPASSARETRPATGGEDRPQSDRNLPAPPAAETSSRDVGSSRADADPRLFLTVNDSDETLSAYRGWPLMIEVGVFHPAAFDGGQREVKGVKLLARGERWRDVIRLVAKNDRGAAQEWKWDLAEPPPPHAELRPETAVVLIWFQTPGQTAEIPPGDYQVEAFLDTGRSRDSQVWKGMARSAPLVIKVRPQPAKLTAKQTTERLLLEARLHLLQGAPERALPLVDELSKLGYDEQQVQTLHGEILAAADKTELALEAYEAAIAAFFKRHGKKGEPPLALLRRHSELLAKLVATDAGGQDEVVKSPGKKTENRSPLTVHELRAETRAGIVAAAPFPASATMLVFRWELGAAGDDAPVEARWSARSSKGAAQGIATAQSKKGQTSGEFSLSRPEGGFPPGNYRLELRQGGRLIHSEEFTLDRGE